jgi:hypothetical protein
MAVAAFESGPMPHYALSLDRIIALPCNDPAGYTVAASETFMPRRAMTRRTTPTREQWQGVATGVDDALAQLSGCVAAFGLAPEAQFRGGKVFITVRTAAAEHAKASG